MTLTHLTGANCSILVGGSVWAAADFEFKQTRSAASHARTGYISDVSYPGKYKPGITCKNVMRSSYYLGQTIAATAITGTAGTIKTGVTLTADGYTASTTPAIATPSRISLTVQTAAVTTAGYVTVMGTGSNGALLEEDIYVGTLGVGVAAIGQKLFSTVVGVYVTGVRSTTGTLTVASVAGASYYVPTTAAPGLFTLLMQGIDDLGNFVKVQATGCWISSSVYKSGDSGTVVEDNITFEITDPDNGIQIWDVTSN